MSENKKKEVDFDDLRFIRVFTPMHVPKELIEQIRDRDYEVEDWYKYQEMICTKNTPQGPVINPLSMLYVVADEGNKVVGMMWCILEVLEKKLIVQTFSMNKKYWLKGKAVTLVSKKAKEIAKECNLKKIVWCTNYPKHSERYGFKRSKSVLMEYQEVEDGCDFRGRRDNGSVRRRGDRGRPDGVSETLGECSTDDRGTGGVPIESLAGIGTRG
jgi:hypothetical protein